MSDLYAQKGFLGVGKVLAVQGIVREINYLNRIRRDSIEASLCREIPVGFMMPMEKSRSDNG